MKNIVRTSVSLDEEERTALVTISDRLIKPLFGEHNMTQAIAYCIRFTLENGVNKEVTA